ncbi:MAG: hypothetical protein CL920_37405 [Deltaproteobacteria bacterium]|nr:hypothetical protein [Deltaproteobacteria bacterium]MBU54410.1 hypothetical protein [Deltaproteobacteria bacterium]
MASCFSEETYPPTPKHRPSKQNTTTLTNSFLDALWTCRPHLLGVFTPNPTILRIVCVAPSALGMCSTVAKRRFRVNTKDTPQTQPPKQCRLPIKKTMSSWVGFLSPAQTYWSSHEKDIQHRGRTQGPTLRKKCNIMLMRLLRESTTYTKDERPQQ